MVATLALSESAESAPPASAFVAVLSCVGTGTIGADGDGMPLAEGAGVTTASDAARSPSQNVHAQASATAISSRISANRYRLL